MRDEELIELYFARDERAIAETAEVYGGCLLRLAANMVCREDAEECVNDTYLSAWNRIPPTRPQRFFAWLARVCRNHAISRIRWESAGKRSAELVEFSQEMAECIPDSRREQETDAEEIGRVLSDFLHSLPKEKRIMFMRRYWYGDSVQEVAVFCSCSESKVKTTLHRLRLQLKNYLFREDIFL